VLEVKFVGVGWIESRVEMMKIYDFFIYLIS